MPHSALSGFFFAPAASSSESAFAPAAVPIM